MSKDILAGELIPVADEGGQRTVSGRDLHKFLQVKTHYKDWFPRMVEYGFVEGEDFSSFLSESSGGRPSLDHALGLDMAKELCMIQRTDLGKQARRYFIEVEKRYRSTQPVLPQTYEQALEALLSQVKENKALQAQAVLDKPKTVFADAVSASKTSILVGELAKLLRQNGVEVGQQRLFAWLREKGYLIRASRSDWNMPTQRSVQLGWFEIKETAITHSDGHVTVSKTPKVTGKGQQYFINLFLSGKAVV